MTEPWTRRIERARHLMTVMPESAQILAFYVELAGFQRNVFESLKASGATDTESLDLFFPPLMELLSLAGTEPMKAFAAAPPEGREELPARYWAGDRTASPEEQFFARALLQPYAEYLATRGAPDTQSTAPACPFCGSNPVVGVLRGEGEGAKRSLICGLCGTEWLFRRVACPNCGETDKEKLPVFIAEQTGYVRVEACDSCGSYLKSVDLTRDGHAIPVVDELATPALSIYAQENGYTKIEPNLLGM